MKSKPFTARRIILTIMTVLFILIGLVSTAGHYLFPAPTAEAFETAFYTPGPEWFLQQLPRYDSVPVSTFLHIVPAFLFMLFLGIQLSSRIRNSRPVLHRATGRVLITLAIIFNLSGMVLSAKIPFGGSAEFFTTFLTVVMFFYFLYRGVQTARYRQFEQHRAWMLRMIALSFMPLTLRLLMGIVAGPGVDMSQYFVLLTVASTVINLFALEVFVLRNRKKSATHLLSFGAQKIEHEST